MDCVRIQVTIYHVEVLNDACSTTVGDFDDHKSAVGRVEWNITGCVTLPATLVLR